MSCQQRSCSGWCACLRLRRLGVRIVEADIAEKGWYDADRNVVVVREGMTVGERRSTLAHELVHVEAHDVVRHGLWRDVHEAGMEARADEIASRNLIRISDLIDAMCDTADYESAAEALGVDVDLLQARLDTLTPAERWHLEQATRRLA
jgi:Zn-dependent peptidase ImmA (M78 family)